MAQEVIRPLRSEADYEAALDEIEAYFDNEPRKGTAAADRFDLLALVIEDYERKRWPIDPPDPIDAIRFSMEFGRAHPGRPRAAARLAPAGVRHSGRENAR